MSGYKLGKTRNLAPNGGEDIGKNVIFIWRPLPDKFGTIAAPKFLGRAGATPANTTPNGIDPGAKTAEKIEHPRTFKRPGGILLVLQTKN
jgi:hypothetical protein